MRREPPRSAVMRCRPQKQESPPPPLPKIAPRGRRLRRYLPVQGIGACERRVRRQLRGVDHAH
jgi:hypothetical protein